MARAISTRTTRRTRASIRTTSPTRFAGASTTGRPTGGSRPSSAGGSPSGGAGARRGGGRRRSRVLELRPDEVVALGPARARRHLRHELLRRRVVGTDRGRARVARRAPAGRPDLLRQDRSLRRDLHGVHVPPADADRARRDWLPHRVHRRRADGVSRGDVSPTGHARLDLHAMRVPAARGARTPHALRLVPPCRGARQPHRPVDDRGESVAHVPRLRVGVVFGGRSGEHEVSLASAASVIAALERRGHTVVPIGIARDGRWVVGGDPLRALAAEARVALPSDDGAGEVKKALADRADAVDSAATASLARTEPAGGLPAEVRHLDVVVIMLHGPYGEDGTIQGLFELADLPYVGAGVLASAVGMDKVTMKAVFRAHGLPMVEHEVVMRHEWRADRAGVTRRVAERIGVPCFVKPSNLGSSVGISKVRKVDDIPAAIDEAARYDRKILIERAAVGREVEVSILGNNEPVASLPAEIRYGAEWYDYATKYAEGQAQLVIPAPIGPELTRRVQELGVAAFKAIDCAGMARVDFFLEDHGRLLLNEINTIPGFTATSGYARMWEASGLDYVTLVNRLIDLALERHRDG